MAGAGFLNGNLPTLELTSIVLDEQGNRLIVGTRFMGVFAAPVPVSTAAASPAPAEQADHLRVWPNPFRTSLSISFDVPRSCFVDLAIHAVDGRRVQTLLARETAVGSHRFVWNGKDAEGRRAATGVYYVRLSGAGFEAARKVVYTPVR